MTKIIYNNSDTYNSGVFMDNDETKSHKVKITSSFLVENPTENEVTKLQMDIRNLLSNIYYQTLKNNT